MKIIQKIIGWLLLFWVWAYLLGALNNFLYNQKGDVTFVEKNSTTSNSNR